MAIQIPTSVREFAPSVIVVLVCALLTLGAYSLQQRLMREQVALHAAADAADAAQYERTLEQGIRSYVQLSRDLAGFIVRNSRPPKPPCLGNPSTNWWCRKTASAPANELGAGFLRDDAGDASQNLTKFAVGRLRHVLTGELFVLYQQRINGVALARTNRW